MSSSNNANPPVNAIILERCEPHAMRVARRFQQRGYSVFSLDSDIGDQNRVVNRPEWVKLIDFSECIKLDAALVNDDYRRYAEMVINSFSLDRLFEYFGGAIPNCRDAASAFRVLLYGEITESLRNLRALIAFAEAHRAQFPGADVKVICSPDLWRRRLDQLLGPSLIFPRDFKASVRILVRRVGRVLVDTVPSILLKGLDYSCSKFHKSLAQGPQIAVEKFEVLFFPHKSINYGGLYNKDHYYSEDVQSPFYRGNILHLELEGDPGSQRPPYWDPDECSKQPLLVLPGPRIPKWTHSALGVRSKTRLSILRALSLLLAGRHLVQIAFVLRAQIEMVLHFRSRLEWFRSAKIALVGYDILFPPTLSLALQSINVSVVAAQERFFTAFFRSLSTIFDYYFVASSRIAQELARHPGVRVQHYCAVGMQRVQLIKQNSTYNRQSGRKTVLVLDWHSEVSPTSSAMRPSVDRLRPLNNWKNNHFFYRELAKLCGAFPSWNFRLRGKNLAWLSIPFFSDVKRLLLQTENLTLVEDYSRPNIQYQEAAEACVVVGRHTSLLDESWACGKPVVYFDYNTHAMPYVQSIWDYEGVATIATGWDQIVQALEECEERDFVLNEQESIFRRKWFAEPRAKQAHEAILDRLNSIYSTLME